MQRPFLLTLLLSVQLLAVSVHGATTTSNNPALSGRGVQKKEDPCSIAVKHYELKDKPDSEIVDAFNQLANNKDVRGTMWLARLYNTGRCSLPTSPELARELAEPIFPEVKRLAENGDPEAQFLVGSAYHVGFVVEQDLKQALRWYSNAVDGGQFTAMVNLANMLASGHGTDPDIDRARQLYSRAAGMGSKLAANNLKSRGKSFRDDSLRFAALRTNTLVRILGLQFDQGVTSLTKNGLVSDPKAYVKNQLVESAVYHFPSDGILLGVDLSGRITLVEGHSRGFKNSKQFRGEVPLGLSWNMTAETAQDKLGDPDDQGTVQTDQAFGTAYRVENLSFAVMFREVAKDSIVVWRVFEKWGARY